MQLTKTRCYQNYLYLSKCFYHLNLFSCIMIMILYHHRMNFWNIPPFTFNYISCHCYISHYLSLTFSYLCNSFACLNFQIDNILITLNREIPQTSLFLQKIGYWIWKCGESSRWQNAWAGYKHDKSILW